MNIAIFGANGTTGRLLTEQALAAGHTVTAVTRHPESFPLRHDSLHVMRGDVLDPDAVDQAVAGQDAVLSALGVPFGRNPIRVYSQGAAHIMQSMKRHRLRRFVCISSSATEPHFDPQGGFVFERIVQPAIVNTIGRTTYEDMRRMEDLVRNSDLDWTVVRPSGLFETEAVTPYEIAETYLRGRFTSRTDLADCMLQQLADKRFVRKIMAVVTVSERPSMVKLILKEAFKRKPAG